jgi:hypothetical protein
MLKAAGLTFPENLRDPIVIENAIKKAIAHNWPFNPNEQVTGSSGDDVGLVDYVRLSFILFGEKVVGFFLTYFMLVGTSFLAAIIAFRKIPGILAVFVLYAIALFVLLKSALLDPRFLSTLALVPAAHIALAMLVQLRPSTSDAASPSGGSIRRQRAVDGRRAAASRPVLPDAHRLAVDARHRLAHQAQARCP